MAGEGVATRVRDWDNPQIDLLTQATLGVNESRVYGALRDAAHAAQPFPGLLPIQSPNEPFTVDLLLALLDNTLSVMIRREKAPFSLSPAAWMQTRSATYVTGRMRPRFRQIRNAYLRQTVARRWEIELINFDQLCFLFADSSNTIATCEERLAVLPCILHSIRRGQSRVCYVAAERVADDYRYFSASEYWMIELVVDPITRDSQRRILEISNLRRQITGTMTASLARTFFETDQLTHDLLERRRQDAYDISKTTFLNFLEVFKHRCAAGPHGGTERLSLVDEVREAIDKGEPFAAGKAFEISEGYRYEDDDEHIVSLNLQESLSAFGVAYPLPSPQRPTLTVLVDEVRRELRYGPKAVALNPKDVAMAKLLCVDRLDEMVMEEEVTKAREPGTAEDEEDADQDRPTMRRRAKAKTRSPGGKKSGGRSDPLRSARSRIQEALKHVRAPFFIDSATSDQGGQRYYRCRRT